MPTPYAATNSKSYLDAEGLEYFSRKLNNYPTNDVLSAVVEGVQDALDTKLDASAIDDMAGNGDTSVIWSADKTYDELMLKADKDSDAVTGNFAAFDANGNPVDSGHKDADYMKGMVILSYGNSTWNDFLTAYTANRIIYCRASTDSNPASGDQLRMAFLAYVNSETNPTEAEFQYYRSVSSHGDSQQGDQVFVYKVNSTGEWTVTRRNTFTKVIAGDNLTSSFVTGSKSEITISGNYSTATTSANGLMSSTDKTKLDGVATGAEVNQNAFSNVKVGSTTVSADAKTDTLEFVAGSNVTITPDATNDKITITATDTTYSNATTTAAGLMSAADKSKLDSNVVVVNQGTSNAGKFLIVNSSGNVEAIQMSVWQGGAY